MNINGKIYRELRCRNCRKLICYEYVYAGRIGYNCPRCGEFTEQVFKSLRTPSVEHTMSEYIIENHSEEVK